MHVAAVVVVESNDVIVVPWNINTTITRYIKPDSRHSPRPPHDTAMSSTPSNKLSDKLKQAYNAALLQVFYDLETEQQAKLYYYFTSRITRGTPETLYILRELEDTGEFSWSDVSSLKEALTVIGRVDLVKNKLTVYEIKRDLTILLDFYARMRQNMDSYSLSPSVELVAGCLLNLMTAIVREGFDINIVRSLSKPTSGIRKVLLDWETEIERELSDPWQRLTFLALIAGEMIAEVLASENPRRSTPDVFYKTCSTMADVLCSRMMKLGLWEDFCDHVKERYDQVRAQHHAETKVRSLTVNKKMAEAVQQLKESSVQL